MLNLGKVLLGLGLVSSTLAAGQTCTPRPPVFVADQVGDPTYCPKLRAPAFPYGAGPKVLFDEGHHNWGKISADSLTPGGGRYKALGEVLKADGYRVDLLKGPITAQVIAGYDLFISIAPLPSDYFILSGGKVAANDAAFSGKSPFTAEELKALHQWVRNGGSLLFNTEHQPFLASAKDFFSAFGIHVEKDAFDVQTFLPLEIAAPLHPIMRGIRSLPIAPNVGGGVHLASRDPSYVPLTRFRSAFLIHETLEANLANFKYLECQQTRPPSECESIGEIWDAGYWNTPTKGDEPMKAFPFGRGRVVLYSEFSTLTSLFDASGSQTVPYGGLRSDAYSRLILNTLHWLTRALD